MLDPVSAVAFEMQAAKGVFALLLRSGVSRAAKIPTGWDITLDLVRRVADEGCPINELERPGVRLLAAIRPVRDANALGWSALQVG